MGFLSVLAEPKTGEARKKTGSFLPTTREPRGNPGPTAGLMDFSTQVGTVVRTLFSTFEKLEKMNSSLRKFAEPYSGFQSNIIQSVKGAVNLNSIKSKAIVENLDKPALIRIIETNSFL